MAEVSHIGFFVEGVPYPMTTQVAHHAVVILLAMFLYISALLCSHLAAFRVQTNMRKAMMEHVMKLPMGYIESEGSGKIRKIVAESSAATETFLAHSLPDKAVSWSYRNASYL